MSPFAVFVGAGLFVNFVFKDDLRIRLGGAALEFANFLAMDNRGVRRDAVHKVTIMGDQNKLAVENWPEIWRSNEPT